MKTKTDFTTQESTAYFTQKMDDFYQHNINTEHSNLLTLDERKVVSYIFNSKIQNQHSGNITQEITTTVGKMFVDTIPDKVTEMRLAAKKWLNEAKTKAETLNDHIEELVSQKEKETEENTLKNLGDNAFFKIFGRQTQVSSPQSHDDRFIKWRLLIILSICFIFVLGMEVFSMYFYYSMSLIEGEKIKQLYFIMLGGFPFIVSSLGFLNKKKPIAKKWIVFLLVLWLISFAPTYIPTFSTEAYFISEIDKLEREGSQIPSWLVLVQYTPIIFQVVFSSILGICLSTHIRKVILSATNPAYGPDNQWEVLDRKIHVKQQLSINLQEQIVLYESYIEQMNLKESKLQEFGEQYAIEKLYKLNGSLSGIKVLEQKRDDMISELQHIEENRREMINNLLDYLIDDTKQHHVYSANTSNGLV